MRRQNLYKKLIANAKGIIRAYRIPRNFSKKNNNVFSNEEHIIMQILMRKEKKHYRDMPDFLEIVKDKIGLRRPPHFTTINKFALAEECWARLIAPLRKKTKQYYRIKEAHRKKLFRNFPGEISRKRVSICENGISILKNKYGEIIYARKFKTQKIELFGKVLAYNIEKFVKYFVFEVFTFYSA